MQCMQFYTIPKLKNQYKSLEQGGTEWSMLWEGSSSRNDFQLGGWQVSKEWGDVWDRGRTRIYPWRGVWRAFQEEKHRTHAENQTHHVSKLTLAMILHPQAHNPKCSENQNMFITNFCDKTWADLIQISFLFFHFVWMIMFHGRIVKILVTSFCSRTHWGCNVFTILCVYHIAFLKQK